MLLIPLCEKCKAIKPEAFASFFLMSSVLFFSLFLASLQRNPCCCIHFFVGSRAIRLPIAFIVGDRKPSSNNDLGVMKHL
jgi:hypothetical protein